jgi:hypothetical protein
LSFLKNELFLSKAERDYLLGKDQANHDYVCIKSRLNKKVKVFVDQELPLLLENGYLSDIAEFRNIADFRNAPNGLVAQSAERIITHERENYHQSPKRDSNPRPKVYETFALPAELLGLLVFSLPSHVIIGFAQFRNPAVSLYPSVAAGLPWRRGFLDLLSVYRKMSILHLAVRAFCSAYSEYSAAGAL